MSQYASATNRKSGWAAFVRPIRVGQYSSCGAGPARSPHVRAKTSLVISIAMSQRSPSHCSAIAIRVSATASRSAGANALSCATSGHGAKYGSRPLATTPPAVRRNASGWRSRSSSVPVSRHSGRAVGPRMVGGHVVGHVVEDQPEAPAGELLARRGQRRGAAEALVDDVVAHAVGRADDVLRAQVGQRGAVGRVQLPDRPARSAGRPGCAARRPSARRRRPAAPRARPTRRRAPRRARARARARGRGAPARPRC